MLSKGIYHLCCTHCYGKVHPHKKSNQGFASSKYTPEKKRAAQSRGGKAKVAKGFAKLSPEKRREVARKGGLG